MKTITNEFGTYYVDGCPTELKFDWQRADAKVKIFNFKYCDSDTLAFLGWMCDVKQPSERDVRYAMLWKYEDYAIKSGGESMSDHIYSSSLLTTIIDENGNDKDVAVIKKWSTVYKEVLISFNELKELYSYLETPKQKNERILDDFRGVIKYYRTECRTNKLTTNKAVSKVGTFLKENKIETSEALKILNIFKTHSETDVEEYSNPFKYFKMLTKEQEDGSYWIPCLKNSERDLHYPPPLIGGTHLSSY